MHTPVKPSLTLKRRFNAPPHKVYRAWTEAEQVKLWFGPGPMEVASAEFDTRVGGRYAVVLQSPDGETHHVSGVYRDVVPNERLVYTWAWRSTPERESLVTVEFKRDGDGTALTLTHEYFFDAPTRDRHSQGWGGALDKLEKYFA